MNQATLPKLIPAPGGEVAITTQREAEVYASWKYAPARRAGDYVYVSGVVVSRAGVGPDTVEQFKAQTRNVFTRIQNLLKAYGADFADVVMINSFHDWSAPEFGGDRWAQFQAFSEVKDEFVGEPYPAWTAVGTSGLIRTEGIVEVQVIAYRVPNLK
jgi:enamine deaminase RidA (YjgF/YER057c/UK114 family)